MAPAVDMLPMQVFDMGVAGKAGHQVIESRTCTWWMQAASHLKHLTPPLAAGPAPELSRAKGHVRHLGLTKWWIVHCSALEMP